MTIATSSPTTSSTPAKGPKRPKPAHTTYLLASDLAQVCEVDLKTIHNWIDNAHIPTNAWFRSPGRHLRFRAAETFAWLKKQGYTVPVDLRTRFGATGEPSLAFVAQAFLEAERLDDLDRRANVIRDLLKQAVDVDPVLAAEVDRLRKGDAA